MVYIKLYLVYRYRQGHLIDQSRSFAVETKSKKSQLVFRSTSQLNLSINLSLKPYLQYWSFG